jgi:hypothetical protein
VLLGLQFAPWSEPRNVTRKGSDMSMPRPDQNAELRFVVTNTLLNPQVKGKRVTGFTKVKEGETQLTYVLPYLVEDELRLGATLRKRKRRSRFCLS